MENLTIVLHSTLTVPSIMGGAVETLLNDFIYENENKKRFNCTVVAHKVPGIEKYIGRFKYTTFRYITMPTLMIRINSVLINKYHLKFLPDLWEKKLIAEVVAIGNEKVLIEGGGRMVLQLKKKYPHFKIYYHLHADMAEYQNEKELELMNSIEKIIGVSNFISRRQIDRGIAVNKTCFVLNGINTHKFEVEKLELTREEICKYFNLDPKKQFVLFKGRLTQEKGVLELIKAFSNINIPNVELLLAGSVNFAEKRKVKNEYEKKVLEAIKNDDRIKLLGYINYDDIPKLQKISDIAVVPSLWQEPCGLVVIESVVSATPLIATRTGGIPEVVDGTNVSLLNVDNHFIEDLSAEIEKLLINENIRKRISETEISKREYLSTERYYEDLCAVIEK